MNWNWEVANFIVNLCTGIGTVGFFGLVWYEMFFLKKFRIKRIINRKLHSVFEILISHGIESKNEDLNFFLIVGEDKISSIKKIHPSQSR